MKTEDWIKKNNPYKRAKEPYDRGRKDGWKEGAKAMAEYLNNKLEEDISRIDKLIKEQKKCKNLYKMEANKLMIGDWVEYTTTGALIRVAGIIKTSKECNIYAYVGTCNRLQGINERDFEPIHITEEFLQKNGFCSKHNELFYIDQGWYLDIEGSAIGEFNDAYESPKFIKQFTVKYVHELQHFLKLIGIEKDVIV